jgi:hypothetical protein
MTQLIPFNISLLLHFENVVKTEKYIFKAVSTTVYIHNTVHGLHNPYSRSADQGIADIGQINDIMFMLPS